ncbi:membrane protein [Cellvibrio zantedeschiae]|uniref:Membrane protein n=1 Tax=Cellvibrio zantedeschiae TaxID=1237077 RepID=A0ABQ3AVU1_9GAMM|nr:TonB-dependent receptor [Cellvibrio zantedeschiae]GGY67669.1 membrane protein [Cellvibrio zantedeschiae]
MNSKKHQIQFTKKILTSFIGAFSLSLLAHTASAQIGSASVQGMIASHLQPQPGIEVIAKNVDNGYTFRALTQKDGTYSFKGLAPGNYQIFLEAAAGKAPEPVVLKVGQSVALDFEIDKPLTNADKAEEILIVGSQLKIKSSGGEIGTNVSLEQINKLPQNTRNFLAFADLAPGVQFNQGTDGSTSIKGGAQSPDAINVFIDGVGQKNYVLRGGVTGQDSSRGNPFPQSAIGEYKVITQNYSAEYDQLSSAAIVAVTKSGSNEFHGGLFFDYTDEGMRKPRPSEEKNNNEKVESNQKQFGFNVGGPIIQDKMHFFFAYEGKNNADPKDVIPGGGATVADLPSALQAQTGGRSADFKEDLYFGKLSYLVSDEQKLELTAKIRKETELTGIGERNALSYGTDKKNDETRIDLSHNWRTDDWINDAHLLYEENTWSPRPHSMGNGFKYSNGGGQAILNVGGGPDFQDKGQSGWGLQEDFTYLAIQGHSIKTGIKYKSIELHAKEQQPYNPQYEYNLQYDRNASVPFKVRWGAPLTGIGDGTAKGDNMQLGIYIQDEWTATDNLTVNAGLRWDYEESDSFLDYKTPTDVVEGITKWVGIGKSDLDINDYVSTGNNRNSFKNAWQPRIGFSYKFNDEHDMTLFGGVGRAFDRNLFDNLQLETTKATFPAYEALFITADPSHPCAPDACVAWDPKYLTRDGLTQLQTGNKGAGREVFMVNNNLKTPYSDQYSLGLRGSLNENWNGEVSISRIVSKDGFAWRLANRRDDGSFFAPGTTWGAPWGFGIPGFGATIIGDNGIETKANSFYLKLERPKAESNWGFALAYTYTDPTTNRESGEVFALDYPTLNDYGMHPANKVPNHRLVVTTIVGLPLDIDFSAKLNLQTDRYFYGTDCRVGWTACKFDTFTPDESFIYKQLDIAFSKNISTGGWITDSSMTVRLDVLNLFNSFNYDGYESWFGGAGENLPDNFGKHNDSLAGPTRTVKLGVSWNW